MACCRQLSEAEDFELHPPERKRLRAQLDDGKVRIDSDREMELLLSCKLKKLKL